MLSGVRGLPAWLTLDDVQGYREQLAETRRHWKPHTEPRWPDHFLLMGEALVSVYAGEPERGFRLLEAHRPAHARSMQVRTSVHARALYISRHAACAAAALRARRSPVAAERIRWLNSLHASIRALRRFGGPTSVSVAENVEAVLALLDGAPERAQQHLRRALVLEDSAGIGMVAASTRRRLGQMIGGEEGATMIETGEAFMALQGAKNLEAMTELLCPGCQV